jgi:hypothetical protein
MTLNELNFARFDAKLEQRLAEFRAELRTELQTGLQQLRLEIQGVRNEIQDGIAGLAIALR